MKIAIIGIVSDHSEREILIACSSLPFVQCDPDMRKLRCLIHQLKRRSRTDTNESVIDHNLASLVAQQTRTRIPPLIIGTYPIMLRFALQRDRSFHPLLDSVNRATIAPTVSLRTISKWQENDDTEINTMFIPLAAFASFRFFAAFLLLEDKSSGPALIFGAYRTPLCSFIHLKK